MNSDIRLILTDLDDTLLRSDKTVSDRTLSILRRCQECDIRIGFATLRGRSAVSQYESLLHPDVLICNGGSVIYSDGDIIHAETFTLAQTRMLLSTAYKLLGERCEMTLDTPEHLYWNRTDDKSATYEVNCLYDDMKDFQEPACKMCIQTTDADIASRIANSAGDISYIPFSDIPWYKFSPKTATKENGVHILSDYLRIPLSEIAVFGDDFSDIGMIQAVGFGVAMQNAIEQVKQAAKYITLNCNEDGVADWIEKNISIM